MKKILNLSNINFYLLRLIFLLFPFQYRIFRPNLSSFIQNFFIEYNAFYLTGLEILIIFFLFLNFKQLFLELSKTYKKHTLFFWILLFLSWINLFNALNFILAIHKSLHLILWSLFVFLTYKMIKTYRAFLPYLKISFFSGFLVACLALAQFFLQHSLSLKYLGESLLKKDILGVAKIDVNGEKIIRAYGSFPHPNILAAYLFILTLSLLLFFLFIVQNSIQIYPNLSKKFNYWIIMLFLIFFSLALFFTFSRAMIVIFFILLFYFAVKFKKYTLFNIPLIIYLSLSFFFSPILKNHLFEQKKIILNSQENLSYRKFYNTVALTAIRQNFFFGVGMGNFINYFIKKDPYHLKPWEYQPVHNTFLYLFAELGILLSLFLLGKFFFFLSSLDFTNPQIKLISIALILLIFPGFLDHYFFSFPQGFSILALLFLNLFFLKNERNP